MKKYRFPYANDQGRCHDCGVSAGEWHYDGCDVERCPRTFQQRLGCDCGYCDDLNLVEKIPFGFEDEVTRKLSDDTWSTGVPDEVPTSQPKG